MSWHRKSGRLVLDRRTLLRGTLAGAAVSLALPPLEAMFDANGEAYALDGVLPKRFGLFFWGNGNRPERWAPSGTGLGPAWSLSETLQPLAAVKPWLTVVTGTDVKLPNDAPHSSGAAGVLTGHRLGDAEDDNSFQAPTIDQVIAQAIGGQTLYRSLETGVDGATGRSFNGPNSPNPPETSPIAFFDRVFGPTFREPGQAAVDPRLGLRRSVLDAVSDDIARLEARVGAADRARLDQHLSGLRDLEARLALLEQDPPDLAACARPAEPDADYPPVAGRPQLAAINEVFAQMLAMACACDQTRVFSHWFTDPVSDKLFPGASAGHHDLTHNEGGDQPEVQAITVQCVEAYAALLQAFADVPEGSGTLLDHCVILGTTEVSLGQTHSILDIPILLGGSASGALKTDHHLRALGGENVSKVLLALIQAMDVNLTEFGSEEGHVTEPLGDLFA
ncbi:MAG: DUF1552 domain-containing protein [Deltaproteobacteria bacterium]|nr:MAG: DUF1552 domain-containing protein [Deltaproteobacteria bacterium]